MPGGRGSGVPSTCLYADYLPMHQVLFGIACMLGPCLHLATPTLRVPLTTSEAMCLSQALYGQMPMSSQSRKMQSTSSIQNYTDLRETQHGPYCSAKRKNLYQLRSNRKWLNAIGHLHHTKPEYMFLAHRWLA